MDGMGLKGDIMYEWVTDKKFIKETYSTCADIVNQLVQRLNKEGINSYFFDVGSKRRNMITRNGKAPIDFDFNLFIENEMRYNCKELKEYIMNIFNEILKNKKWRASKDSTSVITTGPKAECVVTDEGNGILEIKNIAVDPENQGKGYGKALIDFLASKYADEYSVLQVGTGDSPLTIPFYEKCGFVRSHKIPNFFTDNYDHTIYEGGVQLIDMVYLQRCL